VLIEPSGAETAERVQLAARHQQGAAGGGDVANAVLRGAESIEVVVGELAVEVGDQRDAVDDRDPGVFDPAAG
jgi:hypothetical protein